MLCNRCREESYGVRAMSAQMNFAPRFVRKTQLATNEYHKNFFKLDREIINAVTSAEADAVTPLMSKIYLRLVNAPDDYWEREGVLRFEARVREGRQVKAWDVLCELLGVASATANKVLKWLHEQGIIGYFSGKNGVGLRIFLNRAVSSIGVRAASAGQKILRLAPASSRVSPASTREAAFNDSFAVLEISDTDLNPHAPKNGADANQFDKNVPDPTPTSAPQDRRVLERAGRETETVSGQSGEISVNEIVERLRRELEPCVKQAAAQSAAREMACTRQWFETKALPKAVRVAQHETFHLLRKHGHVDERSGRVRADLELGRQGTEYVQPPARTLTPAEIRETAETCIALLETQGKSIELTLSEISSASGGWLLPDDAPRVRETARALLGGRDEGGTLENRVNDVSS